MAGAPVPVPVPVPAPGLSVVDVVVTTGLAAPLAPGTADAPAAGDGVTTAPACAPEDPEEQADISAVNAVNATGRARTAHRRDDSAQRDSDRRGADMRDAPDLDRGCCRPRDEADIRLPHGHRKAGRTGRVSPVRNDSRPDEPGIPTRRALRDGRIRELRTGTTVTPGSQILRSVTPCVSCDEATHWSIATLRCRHSL
ncbi:hypothetical protein JCM9957A_52470 [Kineosporia succinea]